ncbi:MAG TPA: FixH family protein [Candidatus Obscuribacterales bacterium]
MKNLFRPLLGAALSMVLLNLNPISLPAAAAAPKSMTKSVSGISYRLTLPHPLPIGEQKLILRLSKGAQLLKGARLTAVASMGDGMQSAVKITPRPNGELELRTRFSMGGEWELRLQQTAPVKSRIVFTVTVGD